MWLTSSVPEPPSLDALSAMGEVSLTSDDLRLSTSLYRLGEVEAQLLSARRADGDRIAVELDLDLPKSVDGNRLHWNWHRPRHGLKDNRAGHSRGFTEAHGRGRVGVVIERKRVGAVAERWRETERGKELAHGFLRRLARRERIVLLPFEPGREHCERAMGVEVPFDGTGPGGVLSKRVLLAGRRRYELAVEKHVLGSEDGCKLGLLAHHREADGPAGAEARRQEKQCEHAREQAQIEVRPLGDANAGEDQRPYADEHDYVALLGQAVIGNAPRNNDEQQHDRRRHEQDPIAPKEAEQRTAFVAARKSKQERHRADEEIGHDHGRQSALGQLPGERDLDGVSVEDGGIDEKQGHEHKLHERRRGAHGEILLFALGDVVVEALRREGKETRRRDEAEAHGPNSLEPARRQAEPEEEIQRSVNGR